MASLSDIYGGFYDPRTDTYADELRYRMKEQANNQRNALANRLGLGAQQEGPQEKAQPVPPPEPNKVLLLLGEDA